MRAADFSAPGSDAPGFESLQQAAQWFALLRSGEATETDRVRWRAWMDQRGEHGDAWRHVENVSRRFAPLRSDQDKVAAGKALDAPGAAKAARRRSLRMIAALSGTGLLGWVAVRKTPLADMLTAWRADYRTGVGEVREVALADGTRVWLNTASAMDVDYQAALRRVHLLVGEVLIETAEDARRSFVVDTDHGRMRALGTRFTARQSEGFTYLAVYEGQVEVRTASTGHIQVIEAGRQVTFTPEAIAATQPVDRARQAWAKGILLADNISLGELVGELARYRHGYLGCSPQAAGLRAMGAFPLKDPDRVLTLLENALPVRVRRTLPWWVSIEVRA